MSLTFAPGFIEISSKGKWRTVPSLRIDGLDLIVTGKWLKVAVVEAEEWLDREVDTPDLCVKALQNKKSHRLRADIFTFTQMPSDVTPKYSYALEWESVAVLPTTSFQSWWDALPQEARKNVRRAQKRGVLISARELDEDLCRQLVELNNDSPIRQGKRYTHYGKTVEQVKKDQESFPERRELLWAHAGDELIGFLKIVYRGNIASILQLLPKASQQDKRPANALIAKAVELCASKGISQLIFGKFHYGNKRDSSLTEFKSRNGFEELLVPRYYVPLTWKGALCMRLGLHRGLMGILPAAVIRAGLRARTALFRTRSFLSRCSLTAERPNRNRQVECANPPAGSNC